MTFTMNDLIELEDMVSTVIGIARRSGEGPHVQKICDRAKAATVKAIITLRDQAEASEEERPLTTDEKGLIDAAWESHKAAAPSPLHAEEKQP